jgi:N-acetylmuramoyl-L-alanine amidase
MNPVGFNVPSFLFTLSGVILAAISGQAQSVLAQARAQTDLFVVYPSSNHETTASKIFLIGTAPVGGEVLVNGSAIARSRAGHFAPSFPLQIGRNTFTLQYQNQELKLTVTRLPSGLQLATGQDFAKDSLTPAVAIARLPKEWICFAAVAAQGGTVTVKLGDRPPVLLLEKNQQVELPPNSAVLTEQNQPTAFGVPGYYQGCTRAEEPGDLGQPTFELNLAGKTSRQVGAGSVRILSPTQLEIAEVTVTSGAARTGPSTDYSRLPPLPKGTQASVSGYEGDWVRLDYGAWIKRSEVQIRSASVPPTSLIRSIKARQVMQQGNGWTEVVFPLQVPVPVSVQQGDRSFTLTLYNTTAQTDTIKLDDDPLIARLDWQQPRPSEVQYVFNLKTQQQWGYQLRYEGTSLVLALRHPPKLKNQGLKIPSKSGFTGAGAKDLAGIKILLDPGHGGPEDLGTRGPTGYPEKDMALKISQLVRQELMQRGATVVMTRNQDVDLGLKERMDAIANEQPAISLSLHYNALPDDGDAIKTQGLAAFWYHPQAHSLAVFLHNHLVKTLNRPSYGVFWNNLALTRPAVAPAVMLELGFMIHPDEYEWIVSPTEQKKLASAIADGIAQWLYHQ